MQGLQNLGSTCAVNSLIQIICRTKYLREIILQSKTNERTLSYELKEILDMMFNKNHSLSPKRFINTLYEHFDGIFVKGEQIDIGELWVFLLDKIHEELAYENKDDKLYYHEYNCNTSSYSINVNLCKNNELHEKYIDTMTKINNNKTSKWLETCQGTMLNIIECKKCNKRLYNFEPFTSIPIVIEEGDEPQSITSMFRNFLKQQNCSGDWKCDYCKEQTEYTKTVKLWRIPKVIIFVVQRFINFQNKNNKPININSNICVKAGSVISNMEMEYKYNCTSIALHYGNVNGGHYCVICNTDDHFVMYDDLNMTKIDEKQHSGIFEKNKDAYMIVYSLQ